MIITHLDSPYFHPGLLPRFEESVIDSHWKYNWLYKNNRKKTEQKIKAPWNRSWLYGDAAWKYKFPAKILCTFKFECVCCPSDKYDIQLVADRNLNSCVIEVMVNENIGKTGKDLIGGSSTRVANFWPSLTPLFWYKLVKTAHVYVHYIFLSWKRV